MVVETNTAFWRIEVVSFRNLMRYCNSQVPIVSRSMLYRNIHKLLYRQLFKELCQRLQLHIGEAAGHDLYAQEDKNIPAKGQGIIGTGIAVGLPSDAYGRIVLRSELAVKHYLTVNTEVIDGDYTGEIKVVLVNLSTEN